MLYVRRKTYEAHKATITNEEDSWEKDRIKAIDTDARGLK